MFSLIILSACSSGGPILSEQELMQKSADDIIKLGADRYLNNDLKGARDYYMKVLDWHTNDREAVAWANYEIGFILYKQGDEKQALEYFETVMVGDTPNPAPKILAAKVKDVINSRPPLLKISSSYDIGTNSSLRTDKRGMITLKLINNGRGIVNRISLEVKDHKSTKGMFFTTPPTISMPVGSTNTIILPFNTDKSLESGRAKVILEIADPRFTENAKRYVVRIPKTGLPKPRLTVTDWKIMDYGDAPLSGNSNMIVNNGETANLIFWVTNTGQGIAYDVGVEVEPSGNKVMEMIYPITMVELGDIKPGEAKFMNITFTVPQSFKMKRNEPKKGAFKIKLIEDREFGESSPIIRFPIMKLKQEMDLSNSDSATTNT